MPITPTSFDNIKVGYISETDGYVQNLSIADANTYAESNPDTEFIFIDGDEKVRFLTIGEVNALTPKNLLRSDPCIIDEQPCGPPIIKFFGGGGVGASANPVVDVNGNLIAVDLVSGGFGYTSPPQVQVIDPCNIGSGAVLKAILGEDLGEDGSTNVDISNFTDGGNLTGGGVGGSDLTGGGNINNVGNTSNLADASNLTGVVVKVIIVDSGQGYLPPPQTVPQYPAVIELTGVTVTNPGFNYDPTVDEIVIEPSNGAQISYTTEPFGKIRSVSVNKGGRFTELPQIRINTETGINATFVPEFNIIRDPEPIDPVVTQEDLVQVFDLVGLNVNGYIDGKEYYGNVYFVNGVKFAGTSDKSGTNIQVYNTRLDSLQKRDTGARIVSDQVEQTGEAIEEAPQDTIESISSPSRGTYSTTPTSAPSTPATTSTPSTTTTPSTGGGYSTPATPAPAPSTPSTPAPPSSSPPSSGGGGGYGGGY